MSRAVFQRTIADAEGNVVPAAWITVRESISGNLVPLFSVLVGAGGLSNPFQADSEGFARFYVEAGRYNITATFGLSVREWVDVDIGGSEDPTVGELLTILSGVGGADAAGDFLINLDGSALTAENFAELVRTYANVPTVRGASFLGYNQPIVIPVNDVSVPIAFDSTIVQVIVLTQGGTGNCTIDVQKVAYASYPADSGDSICGGNKPQITSGIKFSDSTLTSWSTSVSAGDVLAFHLEGNSTFTAVAVFVVLRPLGAQAVEGMDDARVREIVSEMLEEGGGIQIEGDTYTVNMLGAVGPVNLWALLGRPSGVVTVNFNTPPGGIASTTPAVHSLDLRGFTSGSAIVVTALGLVEGASGDGGDGCSISNTFGEDGGSGRRGVSGHGARKGRSGGTAIMGPGAGVSFTLSALGGFIFGGGGGGGGGGGSLNFAGDTHCAAGGGGGAGAGGGGRGGREGVAVASSTSAPAQATALPGGDSTGGVSGAPGTGGTGAGNGSGTGGTGGAGGDWGADGSAGASPTTNDRDYAGGAAGAGGKAIDLNGGSVTITDGNDSTHIKGAVS